MLDEILPLLFPWWVRSRKLSRYEASFHFCIGIYSKYL
jgi:hypothetical protein